MSRAVMAVAGLEKVGRNEPCPCGSGRKYKHCCERTDADSRSLPAAAGRSAPSEIRKRAQALAAQGRKLCATGRRPEAIAALSEAARLEPGDADAHFNLGVAFFSSGQLSDAAVCFQRTLELRPGYDKALRPLAHCLEHLGRESESAELYRKLARRDADPVERRLFAAKTLMLEGSLDAAETELRRVVAAAPENAGARVLIGELLAEKGRFDEAEPHLRRAVEVYPDVFQRWSSGRKVTAADRDFVDGVAAMAARPTLDPVQRGAVHFGLGKAYDDLGDVAAAIGHYDLGNQFKSPTARMNRTGWSARYDAIIDAFSASAIAEADRAARAPGGADDELPILIVGMPRSGTTLVEQILSSHPAVAAGGELPFWSERAIDKLEGADPVAAPPVDATAFRAPPAAPAQSHALRPATQWRPFHLRARDPEAVAKAAQDYLALLRRIGPSALRVTDKSPFNFERLGLIRQALPYARIIHCRRHPVDTCLSMYFTSFKGRVAWSKADLVFQYREYERLMAHWRQVLPQERFTEVQYESLIADREAETRRLIAFCGLTWDDACLTPERNDRAVKTASVWQARQPVYTTSVERWRRYEPWLGELRELLPPSAPTG